MIFSKIKLAIILIVVTACLATSVGARAANLSDGIQVNNIALSDENFVVTINGGSGIIMVDLQPNQSKLAAVPESERLTLARTLALAVVNRVLNNSEGNVLLSLKSLNVIFIYSTQQDEYNRPRTSGIKELGRATVAIIQGKVGDTSINGAFLF